VDFLSGEVYGFTIMCGLWCGFTGGVRSEIGFGSGLLPWCTRCTAFELFSFTSSNRLPISGFSPPMKNKNSQRISGISTNQWRTPKLQRKLFIFLGEENRRTACFESHAVSHLTAIIKRIWVICGFLVVTAV